MHKMARFIFVLMLLSTLNLKGDLLDGVSVKARVAAFFPAGDRVRSNYGKTLPAYEVELGYLLKERYVLWTNFDWISKHGRSTRFNHSTYLKMFSWSLGGSVVGHVQENLQVYVGLGYALTYVHIHNRGTWYHKRQSKYISGVVVKSGLIYDLTCQLFGELFFDYLYLPEAFKTRVLMGGSKVGVGLGYRF